MNPDSNRSIYEHNIIVSNLRGGKKGLIIGFQESASFKGREKISDFNGGYRLKYALFKMC